ncbi:hypothetical protein ACXJJ3_28665 [Kribbella sp. WER1]
MLTRFMFTWDGNGWRTAAEYPSLLMMTDDLPVRVLDVRPELARGQGAAGSKML